MSMKVKPKKVSIEKHRTSQCPHCKGLGFVVDHAALGAEMKRKRNHFNITLKQLKESAGLSIGYWSDLEHGRKAWNPVLITRYLKALEGL